jgi:lysophospholipase L1-like esterase
MAALVAATLLPGAGTATAADPSSGVLAQAHTAGRVVNDGDTVRYSWPGIYFEGRFRGTGVGVVLNDADNDYDIEVDGEHVTTLVTPGRTTYRVENLAGGEHTVRVVKRTESPWATSEFGGFVAAAGGEILAAPAARTRQIEFIGDSYTAGYGNLSTSRDCTSDQVNRTTNTDRSFGALAARRLDADYQVNAVSGRGMVRNYNGQDPQVNYRTYYDRALLNTDGDVWQNPGTWQPQVVVVGLGINDFSTAVNAGEQWTEASLLSGYRTAYHAFLDKLRDRYGPDTVIVVSATYMSNTTVYGETTQQIVAERNAAGDDQIRYWYFDNTGLDYNGCHWHPSVKDHQVISERLYDYLTSLQLDW